MNRRRLNLGIVFSTLCGAALAQAEPVAASRTVMFVSGADGAVWQDMAYLAAVPAAATANGGAAPVIALESADAIPREVADFLRRFKPDAQVHLGGAPLAAGGGEMRECAGASADAAAVALTGEFWDSSERVVLCDEGDYGMGLVASTLAARLRVPLLFTSAQGLSAEAAAAIRSLRAGELIFVGEAPDGIKATELGDAEAVISWLKAQGHETPYFALVNVRDRSATKIRKLSLAAPVLASVRDGMVIPFDDEVMWRVPVTATENKTGVPEGQKAPKEGVIEVPGGKVPFVLSYGISGDGGPGMRMATGGVPVMVSGKGSKGPYLQLDLNADGAFDGPDEGPFDRNFDATLFGRTYHFDFGGNRRFMPDLAVSSDHIEHILGELRGLYDRVGIPESICIVGFPDSIPQEIRPYRTFDLTSDLPYGNVDDDLFSEIAVGRIIGESATFATLHASRIVTYEAMRDASWGGKAGQAAWEQTLGHALQNAGLDASTRQRLEDLAWIEPPSDGKKGKRALSIGADSPLTDVGFIAHTAHSWWKGIGETFDMNAETLLAPAVIESGGCLTAALDHEPDFRSVISRLFRNGAVSFVGQTRPGIAQQFPQRAGFWNTVLSGGSIGEAHLDTQNIMAQIVLDEELHPMESEYYQLQIRSLFGDPAFRPLAGNQLKSAPARVEVAGDRVSVLAPETWWKERKYVPKDWKEWYGKPFYALRGAGAYSRCAWNHQKKRDAEQVYVNAEFTTREKMKSIRQVQTLPEPLGWNGKFTVDENPDGSRTYRWRVRMVDFDQVAGVVKSEAERVDFQVEL